MGIDLLWNSMGFGYSNAHSLDFRISGGKIDFIHRMPLWKMTFFCFFWQTCDTLLTRSLADIYLLAVAFIIPCCAMIIIHLIIFIHTWSSTRRVALAVNTAERRGTSHAIFNDREKSLLKYIIVMMFAYVIGWLPVDICKIIFGAVFSTTFLFKILLVLPIISCWFNIVNILIYHHEFRHYIKERISVLIKRDERQRKVPQEHNIVT